jgi:hypothetical protein
MVIGGAAQMVVLEREGHHILPLRERLLVESGL